MQLIALKLEEDGEGYVAQPYGKMIKYPYEREHIGHFFDVGLPQLYPLKVWFPTLLKLYI